MKRTAIVWMVACLVFLVFASNSFPAQTIPTLFSFNPPIPAKTVSLAGTFNNWDKAANPMNDADRNGIWEITIPLLPGEYQYKFVVDNEKWYQDPKNKLGAPDGFGGLNSVIRVGDYEKLNLPSKVGDGKILEEAIFHEPESPYLIMPSEQEIVVKLRVKRNDVAGCSLCTLKPAKAVIPMSFYARDAVFEYYRVPLNASTDKVDYFFSIEDGKRTILYWSGGKTEEKGKDMPPGGEIPFSYYPSSLNVFSTPEWARDAIFYQIFPERFKNGDPSNDPPNVRPWGGKPEYFNFFGGDLEGVRQGLPYLEDLGISTIYFNPIFESVSNHKYDTEDYMKIDSHFGDLTTFTRLMSEAHQDSVKIVLDGVFNHTGDEFWAFQDCIKRGKESPYWDWYTFHGFPVVKEPKPNYDCWWGYGDLPKLKTTNPDVRKYLFDVTSYWIREFGIDGWRLDVPNEVPHDFWVEFRKVVRSAKSNAYIMGEIWGDGKPWLKGDEFDSVMNYRFRQNVIGFIADENIDAFTFDANLGMIRMDYPEQAVDVLMNLIGSHDTERFLTLCKGNEKKLRLAALIQMTYAGAPCIYYGDEVGMTGGKDPDCRRTFPWDSKDQNVALLDYYKKLTALRKSHASLRRGTLVPLSAEKGSRVYSYMREFGDERFIVVVNAGGYAETLKVAVPGVRDKAAVSLVDVLTGSSYKVEKGQLKLKLLPYSGLILEAR
ncbi:MAG: alpha amylase N-terminal ig-like domain-containing protein [Candidatus Eisenbacteria bacterium]|nr:alpha amylase N-terminal ig-like domain-containing protein [Candidatus Eisenbacteria bacterium]